jgi:Protein of unknown function (DUF2462)
LNRATPKSLQTTTTMVQGKTKGLQNKASSSRHAARAAAAPKKGKKYIPPKKVALIKQASMHQVRCHVFLVEFLPNHSEVETIGQDQ